MTIAMVAALASCSKGESTAAIAASPAPPVSPVAAAAGPDVNFKLCAILRAVTPAVNGVPSTGARAHLVMAVGTGFDANAAALARVSDEIDAISSAGCPEVRAPLLAATRAASLQEAVR